eukprot:2311083-Prymnesium_polylepis.1
MEMAELDEYPLGGCGPETARSCAFGMGVRCEFEQRTKRRQNRVQWPWKAYIVLSEAQEVHGRRLRPR